MYKALKQNARGLDPMILGEHGPTKKKEKAVSEIFYRMIHKTTNINYSRLSLRLIILVCS